MAKRCQPEASCGMKQNHPTNITRMLSSSSSDSSHCVALADAPQDVPTLGGRNREIVSEPSLMRISSIGIANACVRSDLGEIVGVYLRSLNCDLTHAIGEVLHEMAKRLQIIATIDEH